MFYETAHNRHGLPHNPFKSCVVPRCIGWISSLSASGVVNLAPYSFFNAVSTNPPMVMFASGGQQPHGPKDSITNIEQTREFVLSYMLACQAAARDIVGARHDLDARSAEV